MEIFVININESDSVPDELLKNFKHKNFKNEKAEKAHCFTYLMLDRILKEVYQIENRTVNFINNKPVLLNGQKHFSVSHSEDYTALAFSDFNCGCDIEKIKPRNYKKIAGRMNFKCNSSEEFYCCWTNYEATYKLGEKSLSSNLYKFNDYIISVVSSNRDEKYDLFCDIK